MKVVLFCGGRGMRLREFSEAIPKPMVPLGYRPVLWHVMKYYAHFGHKDFILCLGYKADAIKQYFLEYDECISNNFTMLGDRTRLQLHNSDIHDWKITFVDTGAESNIGQRLKAVEHLLNGEEYFLANYSDGLTDFHLPDMLQSFPDSGRVAEGLCVKPLQSYHTVEVGDNGKGLDRSAILRKAMEQGLVENGDGLSDEDVFRLIFHPGFSTAQTVTAISGRGVGMDVVRKDIESLGGRIEIQSELHKGSTFRIVLPFR